MHRLFLGFSLCTFFAAVLLTGCGPSGKPGTDPGEEKISPGEAKPIPAVEPGRSVDPNDPQGLATKTDPDYLPVLPKLSAPTGEEKYDVALGKAFLLMAEKKNAEALESLKEAQAAKETEFIKAEIERLQGKVAREEAARKAADDIKGVLDAGKAADASKLAAAALAQYGDSDVAETLTGLKRQSDALLSAGLDDRGRKQRFLGEAEEARKANNLRTAVLAYEQAVASGADAGDLKDTYEGLRVRLTKYDESRTKANEFRKDPLQLDAAVTTLKVAAEAWDTQQVRQELSEAETALLNRRDRVAIADFEVVEDIGLPNAGHAIAEELVNFMRPRFDVVERSQVKALLSELKIDAGTLATNDTSRTEFGRIAKARYVVLGSVNRLSGVHINARLVDTQTGLVVQTARIVGPDAADVTSKLSALGRMLQMNDDEKRSFERELGEQARPVTVAKPAELPPPPPPPTADAPPPPPPAPIVAFTARPPELGAVAVADFNGFRVVAVGAPPPPPVVVVEAPPVVRDRAFFVAVELGDNCFRRGDFRLALKHFDFAMSLNPGHPDIRLRVMQCRPLCPPPVVVVVAPRSRLVVLPFAEFRDPYNPVSSIPPFLGTWTADAIAPYFYGTYDVVDKGELFWWMGRLGLSMRDVMTNPYARLCLGRALGARYFLMGSLQEVASFDTTTHLIDAELNVQTGGTRVRVQNAAELRFRLGEIAQLTTMPPAQQVVVIQQQQVVQRKVVAAQIEFKKGNFSVSLGYYQEVLATNPQNVEARSMLIEIDLRSRRQRMEDQQAAAWAQQQAFLQKQREQQIAFAAAAEGARIQAQRDAALMGAAQQQALIQQQILAQQALVTQAVLAQQQKNYALQVQLLENAVHLRYEAAVAQKLAEARAIHAQYQVKAAVAQAAIHQEQAKQAQAAEVIKAGAKIEVAKKQQEVALVEAEQHAAAEAIEEYARFVQQAEAAKAKQQYALAVAAYQNAHRVKPSPEVQALIQEMMTLQAKADAAAKGNEKQLEAQLAKEKVKNQELEQQNAKLRAKNQELLVQAQAAMQAREFEKAVSSYKLAIATMQTEEATKGLQLAQAELAKEKTAADAEAKKKSEVARNDKLVADRVKDGQTALAAKQYDKALGAYHVAAALKPGDVEIQKAITEAEQARDQAAAEARKAKQEQENQATLKKLLAAGDRNLKAKQYDAAVVSFTDALKLDPQNADARAGLATAQANTKTSTAEGQQKRADYEQAMKQGRAAMSLKQYGDALVAFRKAQTILPGDAASIDAMTEASKLQTTAEKTSVANQSRLELNQALNDGRAALRSQKLDDAQAAADRAAKIDPSNADVKNLLADIAEAKKSAVATTPKKEPVPSKAAQVDALVAKARAALRDKDMLAAEKFMSQAAALDPTDPDVKKLQADYETIRRANAADGEAGRMLAIYNAAMKAGQAAYAAKDYDTAIAKATEALKAKPGDAAATKLLTDARKADAAAETAAVEAKKKKDAYDFAMASGRKALAAKDYKGAASDFTDALKAMPDDPTATALLKQAREAAMGTGTGTTTEIDPKRKKLYEDWLERANLLMQRKDYEGALEAFQNCLKLIPNDAIATKGVAAAKSAMSSSPPKVDPKKDPPKKDPAPKPDGNAAKIASMMKDAAADVAAGQYVDAYQTYQDVLKLSPTNAEAKQQAVFCQWMDNGKRQLAAGKNTDAAASFDQALKINPSNADAKKLAAQAKATPKKK
jgi:tetratricopeptide (TPR) repeat protein